MLASRRQPLHLPFHPSIDHTGDIFQPHPQTLPDSLLFDDISRTTATPSPSNFDTQHHQTYFSSSPDYSAHGGSQAPATVADDYMSSAFDFSSPAIRIQQSTPTPQASFGYPQQSVLVDGAPAANSWMFGEGNGHMVTGSSMHTPAFSKRARTHQRVPSSSSAGSNSPASPFSQGHAPQLMYGNAAQSPSIAKLESSYHADEASRNYANHLPTPTQTPTQDSFLASSQTNFHPPFQNFDSTVTAHMALKHAFADGNSVTEEDAPGFSHSTRQSVSSFGRNSPATPRTLNGEDFDEGFRGPPNDTVVRSSNQVPKLERTITDIYSDELFNPGAQSHASQKSARNLSLLSPYHNAMMTERLQQANQARSQSPTSAGTRAVSPFRQSSPYAHPSSRFDSSQGRFATAQQAREQQKAEAEAAALSRHNMMSQQQSEPKTISPKDAMLEYHETEEDSKMPLFPADDNSSYSAYSAGTFPTSTAAVADHSYGSLAVGGGAGGWANQLGQSSASYSATSSTAPPQSQFSFAPASVPGAFHGLSPNTFTSTPNMTANAEETPEFPAHLTSMESSASEAPPQSSNNSNHADITSRPSATLADTGTYTCTYHGCTQRFETPQKLQRHKREAHRQNVQQQQTSHPPAHTPGVGSGMTSAALLARNSQAGPHKCERMNPTTGKPCNTIFSRPYDLTRHEDTIHNVRKQKVRCALCQEEKTFSRNDALTRHMRVVHPDVDFPGKHRKRGGRGDD